MWGILWSISSNGMLKSRQLGFSSPFGLQLGHIVSLFTFLLYYTLTLGFSIYVWNLGAGIMTLLFICQT